MRVFLDPLDSTDMELARSWRNDERIWRWCRQNDVISDVQQARWFEAQSKDPAIRMFKVSVYDGEPVGICGLTSIDLINQRAEFSLYIDPEAQGQGLGKEAIGVLFDHGFRDYPLNQIWGEAFEDSPALHLFKSVGMTFDGVRRQFYFREGRFVDAHLISMTRDEWQKNRALI